MIPAIVLGVPTATRGLPVPGAARGTHKGIYKRETPEAGANQKRRGMRVSGKT